MGTWWRDDVAVGLDVQARPDLFKSDIEGWMLEYKVPAPTTGQAGQRFESIPRRPHEQVFEREVAAMTRVFVKHQELRRTDKAHVRIGRLLPPVANTLRVRRRVKKAMGHQIPVWIFASHLQREDCHPAAGIINRGVCEFAIAPAGVSGYHDFVSENTSTRSVALREAHDSPPGRF
jgi:hypothetical protein